MPSKTLHRHFSESVRIWKSVCQYRKVQTFIWMVKMHTSTLVTSICTISLRALCRLIENEGNTINAARLTLLLICSQFERIKSIQ